MKIFSLNIRVLGDSAKRRRLGTLIRTGNFDIVFIPETKREVMEESWINNMWGNILVD